MRPTERIEKLIHDFEVKPGERMRKQMLRDTLETQAKTLTSRKQGALNAGIWRIIMKSRITKIAVAACAFLFLIFGASLLYEKKKSEPVINETQQALKSISAYSLSKAFANGGVEEMDKQATLAFKHIWPDQRKIEN